MTSSAAEAQAGDQPAQGPQAAGRGRRRPVPGTQRGADRRRGALHVPVPRRGRRGPARAARGRAARADPDAQAAGHRPVVPRARAARGLPGRVPARGPPRRARRAVQRPAQPASSPTARWARPRCASGTATRPRSGRSRTRRHARASWTRSWCRVEALRRDCPVTLVPAGAVPPHGDVPAAGRARRSGLPSVRRGEDRAGQPDPPARRRRDRRRLPAPAGPADRVRELDRPLAVPHPGARAAAGDPAAADGPAVRAGA